MSATDAIFETRKRKMSGELETPAKVSKQDDTSREDTFDQDDDEDSRFYGDEAVDPRDKAILEYIESKEEDGGDLNAGEVYNRAFVKKLLLRLEQAITANAEARDKHPDEPLKILPSEEELDESIKALSVLSESDQYTDLVESGVVSSLLDLFGHENTDIIHAVIKIATELIDSDVATDPASVESLVAVLLEERLVSSLATFLHRLIGLELVDADEALDALGLLEAVASYDGASRAVLSDHRIVTWLLDRISSEGTSRSKWYSADVLFQLLLADSSCAPLLVGKAINGLDTLLTAAAAYRYHGPAKNDEEEEFAENVFNCLSILVGDPRLKEKLLELEGVELLVFILKDSKWGMLRALKVINDLLKGYTAGPSAVRFVQAGGLKPLSGILKKTESPLVAKAISIIASLLRWLDMDSPERIRTVGRLADKNYSVVKRIVGVRRSTQKRVSELKAAQDEQRSVLADGGVPPEDLLEYETQWESDMASAGLELLRDIDTILAWTIVDSPECKAAVESALTASEQSVEDVWRTLKDYKSELEQASSVENQEDALVQEAQDSIEMLQALLEFQ